MARQSQAWKKWESFLATLLGGKRRGAQTSWGGEGLSDVIHPFWSIEAKLLSSPHYGQIKDACRQAETSAKEGQCPIAIIKKKGENWQEALVVMRLEEFHSWFGGPGKVEVEKAA